MSRQKTLASMLILALLGFTDSAILKADDLSGHVVSEAGEPLPDVRVDISTAGPKVGVDDFCPSCYLDCKKWAKTDAQGAFTIKDLDPTLKFHLVVTAPGKQTASTDWIDPLLTHPRIVLKDFPDVPPHRILQGTIVDSQDLPVPGARVSPWGAKTKERRWGGRVNGASSTMTDDQGQFRMLLTEDFLALDIEVRAEGTAGGVFQELNPGETLHKIVIREGTSVTGRLTHNGQPVAGQPVGVAQMYRTPNPVLDFIGTVFSLTDENGEFAYDNLPADQPYVIFTPRELDSTGLVLRTSRFEAKANGESIHLGDLELSPGGRVKGRFITPDGEPVFADRKLNISRDPAWDFLKITTDSEGRFEMDNLPPETYEIRFSDPTWVIDENAVNEVLSGEQSFFVALKTESREIDIPLRKLRADEPALKSTSVTSPFRVNQGTGTPAGKQTLSGTVVDRQGYPLENVRVSAHQMKWGRLSLWGPAIQIVDATGTDGHFEFEGLGEEPIVISWVMNNRPGLLSGTRNVRKVMYIAGRRTTIGQRDLRLICDPDLYSYLEMPNITPK